MLSQWRSREWEAKIGEAQFVEAGRLGDPGIVRHIESGVCKFGRHRDLKAQCVRSRETVRLSEWEA